MTDDIAVSICCITYNQRPFIDQAVQGFLAQKTDFMFEILIHDDASSDGTTEYLKNLQSQHPDVVRLFLEEENRFDNLPLGGYIDGLMAKAAHGKYLALCEGDDYWIDPEKLQIQYDFMESHPNHSACAHAARIVQASSGEVVGEYSMAEGTSEITTGEILQWGRLKLPPTASYVYRKDLVAEYVGIWDEPTPVGDFPLELYLSTKGPIGYIDRTMSVYRYMTPGSHNERMKKKLESNFAKASDWLTMLERLDEYTHGQYREQFLNMAKPHLLSALVYLGEEGALTSTFAREAYDRLTTKEKMVTRGRNGLRKRGILIGRPGGKTVIQKVAAKK